MTLPERVEFDAIGTRWRIDTARPLSEHERDAVGILIERFDQEWSRFRADSLVSAVSGGGAVPLPSDGPAMFEAYAALSAATDGAVNPLVGESLTSLGYDATLSLRHGSPRPSPADWQQLLRWDEGLLRLSAPGVIDVGALGKGRLVDLVDGLLAPHHPERVVDASGDLVVHGATERIALEHPYDPRRAIGVVEVEDGALCASATNRRAWGDGLHHVIDGRTGEPVTQICATWVLAGEAMTADAIATALFFDGGPRLAAEWGVEWVRMSTSGVVEWSPGCPAEIFF